MHAVALKMINFFKVIWDGDRSEQSWTGKSEVGGEICSLVIYQGESMDKHVNKNV